MSLAAFKKSYTEVFVSLTPLNGCQQWHRLERLGELGQLIENWLGDAFYAKVEEELDYPEDASDLELWSDACARMCKDTEGLSDVIKAGAQDFVLINPQTLTEAEWEKLQLAENWKDPQAFKYWKKLSAQRTFAQFVEEMQLNETICRDIFFNSANDYAYWMDHNAPRYVRDQLLFFESQVDHLLTGWVGYASEDLFDIKPAIIGISHYISLKGYRRCEPELAEHLRFLSLYRWFSRALLSRLAAKGIEAKEVEVRAKDYFAWLKERGSASTPSARIVFATQLLKKA